MSVNITDVDTFTDPVTAPDDGDPANGAVFQAAPQALANRTRNLKNRVDALYGNSAVALEGALALNGQNVTIGENLTVTKDLTVSDDLFVTDNAVVSGSLTVSGNATVSGLVTASEQLRGQLRLALVTADDADQTFAVGDRFNAIRIPTITGSRTYTISDTGATNGDFMIFFKRNSTGGNTATVSVPTLGSSSIPDNSWKAFIRIGTGNWEVFMSGDFS